MSRAPILRGSGAERPLPPRVADPASEIPPRLVQPPPAASPRPPLVPKTGTKTLPVDGLQFSTGERESSTERLEQAVAAYNAALQERTRERVPLNWATTQNNLGNALLALGERESSTERLKQAVAAYRAALQERTHERVPFDWAMTQNNLDDVLTMIAAHLH